MVSSLDLDAIEISPVEPEDETHLVAARLSSFHRGLKHAELGVDEVVWLGRLPEPACQPSTLLAVECGQPCQCFLVVSRAEFADVLLIIVHHLAKLGGGQPRGPIVPWLGD